MASDGVLTRLQKEVGSMQQEISKLQEVMLRLEAKIDTKFQEFKEEFRGDLQALLDQYFGSLPTGSLANGATDKGKGVLCAPLRFLPKETEFPQAPVDPKLTEASRVHQQNQSQMVGASAKTSRLECPRFDGIDFKRWWTKLK
ncbi:hypothetical protein CXB51_034405 [Gossypium anomalum]|uniref:Uncharacterized protein n=1 Tax=Gossypium anomalum TaxID=47600 RepID=A0A8J5XXH8_9ROSI|nr:hypothetical protein CXB51_034405 [Gossypium anomalum]